jgi:hypothetical protein
MVHQWVEQRETWMVSVRAQRLGHKKGVRTEHALDQQMVDLKGATMVLQLAWSRAALKGFAMEIQMVVP